ncbi:MAG: hypothetical protein NTX33_06185 [Propionibacteriales bacterium]|nr:hypothetical protein [Propionibacteriales bacterium]
MSVKLAMPVALIAVLAFSACNDDDATSGSDDPTSEATTEATTSDSPTETTSTAESTESSPAAPGEALSGDVTAPGTELAIGDTAVLPLTYGTEGTATVEVKVVGISEGTSADLKAAEVDDAADYTPFYIKVEMKILEVGPGGFGSYTPGSDFDGLTGNTKAGSLIVFGDFAPCDDGGFEYDAKAGDTAPGCVPALATKGSTVDGVQFSGGPDDAGYDQFDGKPVVWK